MQITRDTYESYFLDYLEGSLEESLVNEFLDFLDKNPDLKLELQNFDNTIEIPANSATIDKNRLYRVSSADTEEYNHQLVAWFEGDLSETEIATFENSAQSNPMVVADMELIRLTRLVPDQKVVFSQKSRLYRKALPSITLRWWSAAAAIVFMALIIRTLMPDSESNPYSHSPLPLVNEPIVESIVSESPINPGEVIAMPKETAMSRSVPAPAISAIDEPKTIVYEKVPEPLPVRRGVLALKEEKQLLAGIVLAKPSETEPEELYLAERLLDKAGLDDFSLNKMLRAGLSIASDLSNERFSYAVNSEGELKTLAIDTRLFGFRVAKDRKP